MPIVTRSDNQRAPWLMIYGDDGTSKTTQAAGFALAVYERTKKPALFCSWDPDGEQSVPSWVPIELWTPSAAQNPIDGANETIALGLSGKYSAYVTDTTSAFSDQVLKHIVRTLDRKRVKVHSAAGGVSVPDKGDYGAAAACISNWVAATLAMRERGVPVLMCAHSRFIQSEDGEDQSVDQFGGPAFVGKALTREIPRWPGFIGRVVPYVETNGRTGLWLKVNRDGWWSAKDRIGALPQQGVSLTKGVDFEAPKEVQVKQALERSKAIWSEVLAKHERIMVERKRFVEETSIMEKHKSDGESAAKETTA